MLVHALVVAAVWRGAHDGGEGRAPGTRGEGALAGGRRVVQFFTLPAAPPMTAVELPPAPHVTLNEIPVFDDVPLDALRIVAAPPPQGEASQMSATVTSGMGPGRGPGRGRGAAAGPGTGGGGGYILPPSPRGVIVPPDKAPRSVRGRKYRATFWVGADGRVQRVEIHPEIRDAEYRDALHDRLMDFAFYPARDGVGIAVPGVVPIDFAIP